jgi:hypothetical protein
MDVIRHKVALFYLTFSTLGEVTKDLPKPLPDDPKYRLFTVLWDEHNMVFAIPRAID